MRTRKLATTAVAAALLTGVLAGCAHAAPEAIATTEPTAASAATIAPTLAATTAATPTAATVAVPPVGASVPAAEVAAVRKAGGHVYTSPSGGGAGLVVDPAAALPAVVVADAHAAAPDTPWPADGKAFDAAGFAQKALGQAFTDAGLSAFILMRFPAEIAPDGTLKGTLYTIGAINVPVDRSKPNPHGPTAAAALAAAQAEFAAFPDVPVITFDAVK